MKATVTYTTVAGMLMMENRGGVETEYISDPLGNLIQCRDMNGNKTYEAWYWSYGEIREETGTNPSPWGFVGLLGYYTDALNFLYVRARYYRPNLTRWQTVDPLWPVELPYLYCNDQPNIATDKTGSVSIIGSCILSGGYAAILEWIRNAAFGSGGFDNGVCKTAVNCLAAMLGAAISAIVEGITSGLGTVALGCINGLVSGIASTLGSELCDKLYPTRSCWPKKEPIGCDIVGIAVGAILGCVGGLVPASSIYSGIIGAFGPIGAELGLDSCHSLES